MCSTAYFCEPFRVNTALALVFGIPVIPRIRSLNPLFRPNDETQSDPPSSAAVCFYQ